MTMRDIRQTFLCSFFVRFRPCAQPKNRTTSLTRPVHVHPKESVGREPLSTPQS